MAAAEAPVAAPAAEDESPVTGFSFEIVESKDKVQKAFPDGCGPFNIEKTNISGAALSIDWGPPKTWAEREKAVTVTAEKLSPQAQSLKLGASFNLSASPLHPVNLTVEGRRAAGIPENADHFVWVYPATFSEPPSDDLMKQPEVAFFHNGGFMYFDSQLKPVQINAIMFGGDSLCLVPQNHGDQHGQTHWLYNQNVFIQSPSNFSEMSDKCPTSCGSLRTPMLVWGSVHLEDSHI
jgi:hypothetical protein